MPRCPRGTWILKWLILIVSCSFSFSFLILFLSFFFYFAENATPNNWTIIGKWIAYRSRSMEILRKSRRRKPFRCGARSVRCCNNAACAKFWPFSTVVESCAKFSCECCEREFDEVRWGSMLSETVGGFFEKKKRNQEAILFCVMVKDSKSKIMED